MTDKEKYEDAIDSVTWYNGLAEIVRSWKTTCNENSGFLTPPDRYGADNSHDEAQLQVIWMMCVVLFGDYGTSPRYGWISDIDGFKKFIDRITDTFVEDEELFCKYGERRNDHE